MCLCGATDCPRCRPDLIEDQADEREPREPEFDAEAADREAERRNIPAECR